MLLLLSAILLSATIHAQGSLQLKGKLLNDRLEAVPAAVLSLLQAGDSALVQSALSNDTGSFSFAVLQPGNYLLLVQAAGFEDRKLPLALLASREDLEIRLAAKDKQLETVTVSSRKPYIEMGTGKMILNVENKPTNAGADVLELLKKAPGVRIGNNGNITLQGKSAVRVMLNDQVVNLSGEQLLQYLATLTADEVAQLELITQPGARYDAEGAGGFINIRSRKNRKKGLSGSLMANYRQGVYGSESNAAQLGYKHKKLSTLLTYNFNGTQYFTAYRSDKTITAPGQPETATGYDSHNKGYSQSQRVKLVADYALNGKTSFNGSVKQFWGHFNAATIGSDALAGGQQGTSLFSNTDGSAFGEFEVDGSMNKRWSKDEELKLFGDYCRYFSDEHQTTREDFVDNNGQPGNKIAVHTYQPLFIKQGIAKADYIKAYPGDWKLETGLKMDYRQMYNDADKTTAANGIAQAGTALRAVYTAPVYAAYGIVNKNKGEQWQLQLGLRAEQATVSIEESMSGKSVQQQYLSLFPSAFIQRRINEKHQLQLNYSRRVRRPVYDEVSPVRVYADQRNYSEGNPALKPVFTQSMELTHNYDNKLNTTVKASYETNIISQILLAGDTAGSTLSVPANVGSCKSIGMAITYTVKPLNWWDLTLYADCYYNDYDNHDQEAGYLANGCNLSFNMNHQLRLGKHVNAELSGNFMQNNSAGMYTRQRAVGTLQFGIAATLFKDTTTVRLHVQDPVYSERYDAVTSMPMIRAADYYRWDSRQLALSINYNFGKQLDNLKQRDAAGSGKSM